MASERKFAVFILTHGRPKRVITYHTLRSQGYTGDIYLIVDDEDEALDEYVRRYGDQVIVFSKAAVAGTFDEGDNFDDRRSVIYARNASFGIAEELGLDYFLQLDDDYSEFAHRFHSDLQYWAQTKKVKDLDRLFDIMLDYYESIPAVTVALAQGGDYIGGRHAFKGRGVRTKRKAMNTFFCSVRRPFQFLGRLNDDVNTYVVHGNRGQLFLTVLNASIGQEDTQQNAGGLTDIYLSFGTYVKSFYTVMMAPSCVRVAAMHTDHPRLHHRINWTNAVPRILREEHRKGVT